jgi:phosphoribosylglycinamide formyltransferase-1
MNSGTELSIVVLVSGRGSNLQSLIDAQMRSELQGNIRAVVSNRPDAFALERARRAGIATAVVDHRAFTDRTAFDRELMAHIAVYEPNLVAMAGFMRILTPDFIVPYEGRMLNIHPSLLPEFRGLDTHRRALAAGVKYHGCSVHFVTRDVDTGPIVIQTRIEIQPDDDPEKLAERVLRCEHTIYPIAVRWFCQGRLRFCLGAAHMDGAPLTEPVILTKEED